jgi:hypothetical protein
MRNSRVFLALTLLGCGTHVTEPATEGELRIELPTASFSRADARARVIEATVRNASDRPLFTTARDNFGTILLAAEGSDASVERWDGSTWKRLELGVAVEGLGVARINAGSRATLWVDVSQAQLPGTFRVRLAFRADSLGPSGEIALSQTFTVD